MLTWRGRRFLAPLSSSRRERVKTWIIGDVQGCFETFMALLKQCDFQAQHGDRLWLAGDLINRGPRSLETLDWVYRHRDVCTVVLGNHDLHLLMCGEGIRTPKKSDTLDTILEASDCPLWLHWLRNCPLLHTEGNELMVHAGTGVRAMMVTGAWRATRSSQNQRYD